MYANFSPASSAKTLEGVPHVLEKAKILDPSEGDRRGSPLGARASREHES